MKRIKPALRWAKGRGYLKKALADGKALGEKGTRVQMVTVAPGDAVAPHYHKLQTELYYILKGEATLTFSGKRSKARPGDAFVCEPGDVHGIINGSSGEFRFIVFKTGFVTGDIYWK